MSNIHIYFPSSSGIICVNVKTIRRSKFVMKTLIFGSLKKNIPYCLDNPQLLTEYMCGQTCIESQLLPETNLYTMPTGLVEVRIISATTWWVLQIHPRSHEATEQMSILATQLRAVSTHEREGQRDSWGWSAKQPTWCKCRTLGLEEHISNI